MLVRLVRCSYGSAVVWLGPLTGQCGANSVTLHCFVPLSVHLASHMYGWTPVLSLWVLLLLLAVYCCKLDMQCRETYTWCHLLETGREYAVHMHLKWYTPKQVFFGHTPKMTFSSCYNKLSVGNFGLKLHRQILGTPKTNITFCKKGHNRCPLN